jgi:hypothetical protein
LLARELLDRHGTAAVGSQSQPEPPCTQWAPTYISRWTDWSGKMD